MDPPPRPESRARPLGYGRWAVRFTLVMVLAAAMASSSLSAPLYWDTSTAANLQAGSGTWDTGTTARWSTSTAGSNPLVVWSSGADAVFQTGGTNTVTVSGTVQVNSLTQAAGTSTTISGGTIQLSGSNAITNVGSMTINSNLASAGSVTKSGANLNLGGNNSGLTGSVTVAAGQISLGSAASGSVNAAWNLGSSGTLVIDGGLMPNNSILHLGSLAGVAGSTLRNGGAGSTTNSFSIGALGTDTTFAGNIINLDANRTTAIIKVGAGVLTLSGTNTYTGGTTINGGTLAISGGAAIADTGAVTLANAAGAMLRVDSNETIGLLSGGGASGGDVQLQNKTLTLNNTSTNTFSGALQSGLGGTFIKSGAGNLTLNGDNSGLTGRFEVSTGLIGFGSINAGSASAAWDLTSSSATLIINSNAVNNVTLHLGSLEGVAGSTLRNGGATAGTNTFSIGALGTDTTFAGNVVNAASNRLTAIVKVGAGTLTLTSADNTHTGGTLINGGTLLVNNASGSGTGFGGLTVNSGGRLGGTGTVAPTGAHAVNTSGATAPGATGIGTLTFNLANTTGGVNFLSGATLRYDVDAPGVGDLIRIHGFSLGDVVFNNNEIFFTDMGSFSPGLYTLFEFYAADGVTPINHNLTSGLVLGGSSSGTILYSGNLIQVQLNAIVPEPSTLVLLALALGLTGCVAWRRR